MKHRAETEYFLNNPSLIFEYLEEDAATHRSKVVQIYVYLLQSTEFTPEEIDVFHKKLSSNPNNITMSGYDVLIRRGEKQGFQKGEVKTKIQTIKVGYQEGASISFLAKITEWSEDRILEVLKDLGLLDS